MQVRKYKARTIHDAVNLVKQELGPEALILSTRKKRDGEKALSYKNQVFFEITATPSPSFTKRATIVERERGSFSSYIFTKTDETQARGVIISQHFKIRMPISFITTGQRVPEDIVKATKTGILHLLFNHGESQNGSGKRFKGDGKQ